MVKKGRRMFSVLLAAFMLLALMPPVSKAATTQVRVLKECASVPDVNGTSGMYLYVDSADGTNYYALSSISKNSDDESLYYTTGIPVTIENGIVSAEDLDWCIGGLTDGSIYCGGAALYYKENTSYLTSDSSLLNGLKSSFYLNSESGRLQFQADSKLPYIKCDSEGHFYMSENSSPYFTIYEVTNDLDTEPEVPTTPTVTGGYSASLQSNSGNAVSVSLEQEKPTASLQVVATGEGEAYASIAAGQLIFTYPTDILTFSGITPPEGATAEYIDSSGTVTVDFFGNNTTVGTGLVYMILFTVKDNAGGKSGGITLTSAAFSSSERAKNSDLVNASLTGTTVTVSVIGQEKTVTLCDGITGPSSANIGAPYTFCKADDSTYWDYTNMTVTMNESSVSLNENVDGSYTIANVTGSITISGIVGKQYNISYTYVGNLKDQVAAPQNEKATYHTDYTIKMPTVSGATTIAVTSIKINNASITPTTKEDAYYISGGDIKGDIAITIEIVQVSAAASGTGSEDVTIPAQPTRNQSFSFGVTKEIGYDYSITTTVDGTEVVPTYNEEGTYTLPGQLVTGVISINVTKTVNTDGVSVYEYLTLDNAKMWLILDTGAAAEGKARAYNGKLMCITAAYGSNSAYCALTIDDAGSTAESVLAAVKEKIVIEVGMAETITYSADINGTGTNDSNDAQLVWNIYKAKYAEFDETKTNGLNMSKFLLADYNHDKKVSEADSVAVVSSILGKTE